jgi:hypothetical protein
VGKERGRLGVFGGAWGRVGPYAALPL